MASGGDLRGQDRRYEDYVPSSGWTEDSDCHCLLIDLPGFKKKEVKLQVDNYGHVVVSGERKVNDNKFIRFHQSYDVPENSNIDETGGKFEDGILYVLIPKKVKAEIEEYPQLETDGNNQQQQPEQNVTSPDTEHIAHNNPQQHPEQNVDSPEHIAHDNQQQHPEQNVDSPEHIAHDNQQQHPEQNVEFPKNEEMVNNNQLFHEGKFHDAHVSMASWDEYKPLFDAVKGKLKENRAFIVTAVLAFSLGIIVSQKMHTNAN